MSNYKFKTKPFDHQLREWERSRDLEHFAVFWEMGTGKSKLAVDTAAWLWDQGKIDAVLVLANKGSYFNWADEHFPRHLPEHVKYKLAYWDAGRTNKSVKEITQVLKEKLTLRVLLVNVEALAYDKGKKLVEAWALHTKCLCVIDESTSIKNPKALRTKSALKLRDLFPYRRIMTGSPVVNGPLNLYSQAEFLAPWLLGHGSYYSFRNDYCTMVDMRVGAARFKKVTGYQNLEKLQRKIQPFSTIIKKEDCLDLPPKVYETYRVELTAEQKRVYEDLKKRSIAELGEAGMVTVEMVLTKLLRLQQIVCGYAVNDEGSIVSLLENRVRSLLEVLDEAPGKVVVWARFRRDIMKISEALHKAGEKVVEYHGGIKPEARRAAMKDFQEGGARFFIGNPQTGGYGITLTAAATVVYYSNSFDLEQRVQSEDRCHRVGQTKSVTYVDLVTSGTVDEKIIKALTEKRRVADLVLGDGWKELF